MLRIFTEGNDFAFLDIYLKHLKFEAFSVEIAGGYSIKLIEQKIKEYQDAGDDVVLIFDSDFEHTGGGFNVRLKNLQDQLVALELELDIFLFPNHALDGDYESLLILIAIENRRAVFNCFNSYENCINGLNGVIPTFILPLRKSRIYAYFECIPASKSAKQAAMKTHNLFFDNPLYWDLDSEHLEPLKAFLSNKFMAKSI